MPPRACSEQGATVASSPSPAFAACCLPSWPDSSWLCGAQLSLLLHPMRAWSPSNQASPRQLTPATIISLTTVRSQDLLLWAPNCPLNQLKSLPLSSHTAQAYTTVLTAPDSPWQVRSPCLGPAPYQVLLLCGKGLGPMGRASSVT